MDYWPHSHKMVTSPLSLSSTTTLVMPPSMDNTMNHKLDRHSRPLSLGHKHQPGKRSRLYIAMAAANTRQATSKRHYTTPSHFMIPCQLTPLVFSLPRKSSVATNWTSSDSEPKTARLSCTRTCMADSMPTHSPASPLDLPI